MKLNNNCFLFLGLLSLLLTSSCKKVAKEASEEIMEKGTKSLSKEFTEESLENISKRELKTITWEDFYKVIAKKMPSLANALDGLDSNVRVVFEKYLKRVVQNSRQEIQQSTLAIGWLYLELIYFFY